MAPSSHKFITEEAASAACSRASTAKKRGYILSALIHGLGPTAQKMVPHTVSRWVFQINKKIPHRLAHRPTYS